MRLRISSQIQQVGGLFYSSISMMKSQSTSYEVQTRPSLGSLSPRRSRFPFHGSHSKVTNGPIGGRRCCYAMSGMEGGVIDRPTLPGLTPRYVYVSSLNFSQRAS